MKVSGVNHYRWGGVTASYAAKHNYARKWWLRDVCQHCESIENLQMANISGKYLRDKEDWLTLCAKCHFKFDGKTFSIHFQRKAGSTGQREVYFNKITKNFVARIMVDNKLIQLGGFRSLETATLIRLAAEEQLIKEKI